MDREYVLTALALSVCGPAMMIAGGLLGRPGAPDASSSARLLERDAWMRVLLPFLLGVIAFAALMGWWALEPDASEPVPWTVLLLVGAVALIWLRAFTRAAWALRSACPAAGTVGLLRPRIILSESYQAAVDGDALRAAREHEEAHARHHDPLRLWIGQLLTDLQWPLPAAKRRFDEWREALELARDDEARERGVDGADLAAAVLEAARLQTPSSLTCARLGGHGVALKHRIARLLTPMQRFEDEQRPPVRAAVVFILSAATAACVGAMQGETIIRSLLVGGR
jgi:hypothetical protein